MITLAEARERIGDGVVYRPRHVRDPEDGTITSVNDRFVFVRYRQNGNGVATDPADLEWSATL